MVRQGIGIILVLILFMEFVIKLTWVLLPYIICGIILWNTLRIFGEALKLARWKMPSIPPEPYEEPPWIEPEEEEENEDEEVLTPA